MSEEPLVNQGPGYDLQPITLTITLNAKDGGVNVHGPINDRILCYGMIEMAKDAIRAHNETKKVAQNGNGHMLNFLRGGKK